MKTLTRIKGMRFISLLTALAMVFVLVGCGSSGNTQPAVSQGTMKALCVMQGAFS